VPERTRVEQQFGAQPVGQRPAGRVLEHLISQTPGQANNYHQLRSPEEHASIIANDFSL
jgi:hypothetical protein